MFKHQVQRREDLENKKAFYLNKAITDGKLPSPIEFSLKMATALRLQDDLEWRNLEKLPQKMNLINSGKSVVVTGKWATDRPTLAGGFLTDEYVFSQVHFHWGQTDTEGSEHKVNGSSFPLELHVLWYKTCYESQGMALTSPDGVVVVVYFADLARQSSPGLRYLSEHLSRITQPHSSVTLPTTMLSSLLVPFAEDYLAYWGAINTDRCSHPLLWMICRTPLAVSSEDLMVWRTLLDLTGQSMRDTCGFTYPAQGRSVFHVNPSGGNVHLFHPDKGDSSGQGYPSPNGHGDGYENKMKTLEISPSFSTTQCSSITDKMSEKRARARSVAISSIGSPPIKREVKLTKKEVLTECNNQLNKNVISNKIPFPNDIPFIIGTQYNKPENEVNAEHVNESNKINITNEILENVLRRPDQVTLPKVVNKTPINDNYSPAVSSQKIELDESAEIPKPKVQSRLPVKKTKFSHLQSSLKCISISNSSQCVSSVDVSQMNPSRTGLYRSHLQPENTVKSLTSVGNNKLRTSIIPRAVNRQMSTSRFGKQSSGLKTWPSVITRPRSPSLKLAVRTHQTPESSVVVSKDATKLDLRRP